MAQLLGGPDGEVGVPEVFAADDDEVGATVPDDGIGALRRGDATDGADRDAALGDAFGVGHLVVGAGVGTLLVGVDPAGADVDEVDAERAEVGRQPRRVVDGPRLAVGQPVRRGGADEQRDAPGDGVDDLPQEPRPALEVAAVGVLAVLVTGERNSWRR